MRLADVQPQYFPRQHYFARLLDADVFVIRDDVQFVRNHKYPDGTRGVSYQAHTPVKAPHGPQLLTVSVKKGGATLIHQTGVSYDQPWTRKHLNVLASFYRSSPNRRALLPEIEALLESRFATVAALNCATIFWALYRVLGAAPRGPDDLTLEQMNQLVDAERPGRLRRIELGSRALASCESPDPSERIATLCEQAGADEYLAGGTAFQSYLDAEPFRRRGIAIRVQRWSCPDYPQQFTAQAGHLADLSILDLLLNAPSGELVSMLADV